MTKPFKSLGGNAAEAPAVDETTAVNDSPPAEAPAAVEEEVMEEEFVAEDYEELEPIELEFSAVEIAEAIAADSDALLIVAQAMFEDPRVRQYLTQQVAEQAQAVPQRISLKVASPRNNGAPQGQRGTIAQSVQQSRRSFSTVKRSGGRVPLPEERQEAKPSHTLTRMARNT